VSDQWTVGDLVDALGEVPRGFWLSFEWGNLSLCRWESYRGSYDEIALVAGEREYEPFDHSLVGPVLDALKKDLAERKVFVGYKGGDYPFVRERAIWVANHGETSDTMVIGLRVKRYDETHGAAQILTEQEG
jgi:hypothetical protein